MSFPVFSGCRMVVPLICGLMVVVASAIAGPDVYAQPVEFLRRQEGSSESNNNSSSGNLPPGGENILPPVTAVPPTGTQQQGEDFTGEDTDFDSFLNPFPLLSDQSLGGLNGAVRSQRSVFDSPRHISIIDQQKLLEILPQDMGQAIEMETGVTVQRTGRGQSSPFIRGLTGNQVLILIDGIRLNNSVFRAGPNQYFNQVDPNMVERIEVLRGPGSVQYGSDAIGGVINIVTKSAQFTGSNYLNGTSIQRFSSSDLGYQGRVNVEGWVQNTGVFSGAGYGNFNNVDRGGVLGRQPATSFNQYSGDIKFTHVVDDFSEVIVALQHFEQNDVFRTDQFPFDRQRIFDPQQRDLAYIRWQGCKLDGWINEWSVTASYNRIKEDENRREPVSMPATDLSARSLEVDTVGVNFVLLTDLDVWGALTYGFDWYHEDVDSSRVDTDLTAMPPVSTVRNPTFPDDGWYSRYGSFLEWDVQLTNKLSAVSGVRFSLIDTGATITAGPLSGYINPQYEDWSFSSGLTYEVTPEFHLVTSVAKGFRAPNLDDLAATNDQTFAGTQIPNPTLRPERSISYEVGAKLNTQRLRGQVFCFWMDINDIILRQPIGNPLNPNFILVRENRDAIINGVEASAEYMLDCNWSVYGNFSYVYGKDVTTNEPLSRVNPMQGVLGARWRDQDGSSWIDFYAWMVDRQDRLNARDLTDTVRIPAGGTPGYTTLNVRMGYLVSDEHRVTLNLLNLTDKAYRVHGSGADGPGFTAVVGWEWLK